MNPLFSVKFTVILTAALFVPFVMTTANLKLEPYPAIILPSGAGKLDLKEGVINVYNLSIYGYDIQGKLQKIDQTGFLNPIPNHYLYAVFDNEFGLSTKTKDEIVLRGLNKKIEIKRKSTTPEEQKKAKLWLSEKLTDLGLSSSKIVFRYELKKLEINSGREVSKEINDEKIISLR
ncbi:MAG: hypothetical protein AB4368_20435 [Xenococcaceae cyanobacterium]